MKTTNCKVKKMVKNIFKISVICIYICLVIVLILQALKPGVESSEISNDFANSVGNIISQMEKPATENADPQIVQNFYAWVRKAFGHFGAFLVLGIFASATYYMLFAKSTKGKIVGFLVCMFAGFAVAGLTEILQLPMFTPGRTSSFSDIWLDFKGYCCSSLVIYAIIFVVHFAKMLSKRKAKG